MKRHIAATVLAALLASLAAVTLQTVRPAETAIWSSVGGGKHPPHKPFIHTTATHLEGDPNDWTWLGGTPELTARWDPCSPVTWSYPAGASAMVRRITDRAFWQLARDTGYEFQRVESGAEITISTHSDGDPFLSGAIGVTYVYADTGVDSKPWLSSVQVGILDRVARSWRQYTTVLKHELGHAVGLGHAADYVEVMQATSGARRYGAGDRTGLAAVKPAGCEPAGRVSTRRAVMVVR